MENLAGVFRDGCQGCAGLAAKRERPRSKHGGFTKLLRWGLPAALATFSLGWGGLADRLRSMFDSADARRRAREEQRRLLERALAEAKPVADRHEPDP